MSIGLSVRLSVACRGCSRHGAAALKIVTEETCDKFLPPPPEIYVCGGGLLVVAPINPSHTCFNCRVQQEGLSCDAERDLLAIAKFRVVDEEELLLFCQLVISRKTCVHYKSRQCQ